MGLGDLWRRLTRSLVRRHGDVKRFDHDLKADGGMVGRADLGTRTVAADQIVGSVSRWQNLRSDFFYKTGEVTARFIRVGEAMRAGKVLPPLELWKIKRRPAPGQPDEKSRYSVVDGHHRVAMAKRLGQDYLDAHVVEHRVTGPDPAGPTPPAPATDAPAPPAEPPPMPPASGGRPA